jgi:hypothetical protein
VSVTCFANSPLLNPTPCLLQRQSNSAGDVFELHITVAVMAGAELARFKQLCLSERLKAIVIELAPDQPIQPMTCSRFAGTLAGALAETLRLEQVLTAGGFPVTRRKIEAAPWNSQVPATAPADPRHYFEHHGKIWLPGKLEPTKLDDLAALCQNHRAHLSLNALKTQADDSQTRFVTLRAYGVGRADADAAFAALCADLTQAGFVLLAQIAEFCVFDSNLALDGAWGQ